MISFSAMISADSSTLVILDSVEEEVADHEQLTLIPFELIQLQLIP